METKSTSVVKDPCIDNKQLEISIAKQDSLCSPSDMLKSYQLNAVLFSKERTKTHFKLWKFSSARTMRKTAAIFFK